MTEVEELREAILKRLRDLDTVVAAHFSYDPLGELYVYRAAVDNIRTLLAER